MKLPSAREVNCYCPLTVCVFMSAVFVPVWLHRPKHVQMILITMPDKRFASDLQLLSAFAESLVFIISNNKVMKYVSLLRPQVIAHAKSFLCLLGLLTIHFFFFEGITLSSLLISINVRKLFWNKRQIAVTQFYKWDSGGEFNKPGSKRKLTI